MSTDAVLARRGAATVTRIRVVFVTNIVAPYRLPALAELAQGVDLTVLFCSERGVGGCDWRLPDDYPFRCRVVGGLSYRRSATEYHLSPRVLSAIVRERPQVIISGGFSFPTLYAAAYSLITGCQLVIFGDGTSRSEARLSIIQKLARRLLLRFAAGGVGASELAAQRFVELGVPAERVFVSPHTTDIARFWEAAAERTSSPSGSLRVLAVSRLVAGKGIDRLLAAFARARELHSGLELTIVGAGPDESDLRSLAAELRLNVDFRGFVDQPELPKCFKSADVFVFPTFDDTFGIVLLEAAAAGLPMIASPYAGATPELVENGLTGFVIDPDDIEAMADTLVDLARDPRKRTRMGQAAYEHTLARTPAVAAAGYMAAVESALNRASA